MHKKYKSTTIAGVAVLLSSSASVDAGTYTVGNDPGGLIGKYDTKYAAIAAKGDGIRIAGRCASACTVLLHHFPRNRICVTDGGNLGFHTGSDTKGGAHFGATDAMLQRYPSDIVTWINARGGLSKGMMWLSPPETFKFFKKC